MVSDYNISVKDLYCTYTTSLITATCELEILCLFVSGPRIKTSTPDMGSRFANPTTDVPSSKSGESGDGCWSHGCKIPLLARFEQLDSRYLFCRGITIDVGTALEGIQPQFRDQAARFFENMDTVQPGSHKIPKDVMKLVEEARLKAIWGASTGEVTPKIPGVDLYYYYLLRKIYSDVRPVSDFQG